MRNICLVMVMLVICASCGGSSAKVDTAVTPDSSTAPPKQVETPVTTDSPKITPPKTEPPKNDKGKRTVYPNSKPELKDSALEAPRKRPQVDKPVADQNRVVNTSRKDELNDTTLERYIPDSNRLRRW